MEEFLFAKIVSFVEVVIWPTIVISSIVIFQRELRAIIRRFASSDELEMSIGSFTIQAKAMREIHDTIGTSFPEDTLSKAKVKALIETKIRSVQAAMEHHVTESSIRSDDRIALKKRLIITTEDNERFDGETLDISQIGIGFKSSGRLRFHEIVKVEPFDPNDKIPVFNEALIVRIEQAEEGYYYGAKVSGKI